MGQVYGVVKGLQHSLLGSALHLLHCTAHKQKTTVKSRLSGIIMAASVPRSSPKLKTKLHCFPWSSLLKASAMRTHLYCRCLPDKSLLMDALDACLLATSVRAPNFTTSDCTDALQS